MAETDTRGRRAPGPGRPQLHDDEVILAAALAAFAISGYEGMSIRSLGRDLGLSHGALNQRFRSKERLFFAAVDYGFGGLAKAVAEHLAQWEPARSEREDLRNRIRAFLLGSAEHPELVRLMNTLGITDSERLDYVFEKFVEPSVEVLRRAAASSGAGQGLSTRELFFLIAHGAAAPFTLKGLSDRFDATEGPLDPEVHADHMATLLLRILDA